MTVRASRRIARKLHLATPHRSTDGLPGDLPPARYGEAMGEDRVSEFGQRIGPALPDHWPGDPRVVEGRWCTPEPLTDLVARRRVPA